MDIYLRQSWTDKRLNLSRFGINYTVTLNGEDLMEKIWKPDLFFRWVELYFAESFYCLYWLRSEHSTCYLGCFEIEEIDTSSRRYFPEETE